ncbi:MAG: mechanosensitive ion channel domain-containing protein [Candidatus Omnitrophota bacterium]
MNRWIKGTLLCAICLGLAISFSAGVSAQSGDSKAGELEVKERETKSAIEEKKESVEEVAKIAEFVKEEKRVAEEDVKIKSAEAEVAKKEAEVLKKEAEATEDTRLKKEAEKLVVEAQKLEKVADISKEKLGVIEDRERIVKDKLDKQQSQIDTLTKKLQDIKMEKAGERGLINNALRSIPILVMGLILFLSMRLSLRGIEKMLSRKKSIREDEIVLRMKTISKLINWLGSILIIILVLYFTLENFGFSLAPLIAGAGIVGLAFGFGGQYLIRDLINGLFILLEDQYRINDVVKLGEYGGLVEDINLRITTLRDLEGRVIIVPNGEIKTVVNYTKGYAQALLDIGVAYKENVDRVMEVIKDVGQGMRKDEYFGRLILDDLEMLGVDNFADSAVIIKFRMKTLPIKQWEVMREFRRRLKNKFDELGIEIPFPHRTLYMGAGQDNDWLRDSAAQNNQAKG